MDLPILSSDRWCGFFLWYPDFEPQRSLSRVISLCVSVFLWSLTARPWKMMVGRWSFPFGIRPIFRCSVVNTWGHFVRSLHSIWHCQNWTWFHLETPSFPPPIGMHHLFGVYNWWEDLFAPWYWGISHIISAQIITFRWPWKKPRNWWGIPWSNYLLRNHVTGLAWSGHNLTKAYVGLKAWPRFTPFCQKDHHKAPFWTGYGRPVKVAEPIWRLRSKKKTQVVASIEYP